MPLKTAVGHALSQLTDIIDRLTDAEYTRSIKVLSDASIGQHVRHIIEMFRSLDAGYASGCINYEQRERNLIYETDRMIATQAIRQIMEGLEKEDRELLLEGCYHPGNTELLRFRTNYHREVVHNLEHAIHHMAMIRMGMQELNKVDIPEDFGVAAATVKFRSECAR